MNAHHEQAGAAKLWTSCAIVPVKALSEAKSRLGPVLSLALRRSLVLAMFEDVLDALAATPGIDSVLVVTADSDVGDLARHKGAAVLHEDRSLGLNAALSLGAAEAKRLGAVRVLFIPADLPFATPAEIGEIMVPPSPSERHHPVIVPARDGDGTNALLLSPPDALEPNFGPRSFERHCAQARERGLSPRTIRLEGLALDIDEPADLAMLIARSRGRNRYAFLREAERALEAAMDAKIGVTEP
jgi:2-phospho-L-lactate/phosphoenolpyruvate guanylyltransferase